MNRLDELEAQSIYIFREAFERALEWANEGLWSAAANGDGSPTARNRKGVVCTKT
jgi:hypothetical protein